MFNTNVISLEFLLAHGAKQSLVMFFMRNSLLGLSVKELLNLDNLHLLPDLEDFRNRFFNKIDYTWNEGRLGVSSYWVDSYNFSVRPNENLESKFEISDDYALQKKVSFTGMVYCNGSSEDKEPVPIKIVPYAAPYIVGPVEEEAYSTAFAPYHSTPIIPIQIHQINGEDKVSFFAKMGDHTTVFCANVIDRTEDVTTLSVWVNHGGGEKQSWDFFFERLDDFGPGVVRIDSLFPGTKEKYRNERHQVYSIIKIKNDRDEVSHSLRLISEHIIPNPEDVQPHRILRHWYDENGNLTKTTISTFLHMGGVRLSEHGETTTTVYDIETSFYPNGSNQNKQLKRFVCKNTGQSILFPSIENNLTPTEVLKNGFVSRLA